MPQFTNSYNAQNGMGQIGPMQQFGPPPNAMGNTSPMNAPMQNQFQNGQYGQQMQNWKPYEPTPPAPPLIGRWVSKFEEITPQDVPMNGTMCFFPQSDGACIYAMVWGNDGKIVPYRFMPEKKEPIPAQQPQIYEDLTKSLDSFVSTIDNRMTSFESRLNDIWNSIAATNASKPATKRSKESDAT